MRLTPIILGLTAFILPAVARHGCHAGQVYCGKTLILKGQTITHSLDFLQANKCSYDSSELIAAHDKVFNYYPECEPVRDNYILNNAFFQCLHDAESQQEEESGIRFIGHCLYDCKRTEAGVNDECLTSPEETWNWIDPYED
ncbi:hypothetical protein M011DRAFT_485002 [Sporormia fimetaria CBS 119925]|uniref:Secreted protein n=1 Tax=Sporormia fimetaria CBS 119925 TaxID=1340428 RepID=A0A6A6VG80_9PLEO|nr:hypothetical protein M011DRAFT_485002 [Sporormia fimetaria CBS 119925]